MAQITANGFAVFERTMAAMARDKVETLSTLQRVLDSHFSKGRNTDYVVRQALLSVKRDFETAFIPMGDGDAHVMRRIDEIMQALIDYRRLFITMRALETNMGTDDE